jgi:hypothetical protein
MMRSKRNKQKIEKSPSLLLGSTRLRRDLEFAWASGGQPYLERSEGNGQPQNNGTWGLWYSPARPLRKLSGITRRS